MQKVRRLLGAGPTPQWAPPDDQAEVAGRLGTLAKLEVYEESVVGVDGVVYFLGKRDGERFLGVVAQHPESLEPLEGSVEEIATDGARLVLKVGSAKRGNAEAMRRRLPFLNPRPLGLAKSAGLGDRLGLATPGHIDALRAEAAAKMTPILAQQSMRENARTGRHPTDVIDDAMWGVLQKGWNEPWGADADHLKTFDDVDLCTSVGYTFYTIDPGEHVDDRAAGLSGSGLEVAFEALPWAVLESFPQDLLNRLGDAKLDLGDGDVYLPKEEVVKAAVKYGRAVAHTVQMSRRIAERLGTTAFDLEVSVDETEQVTSLVEHIYIAAELKRLGVGWVSMAPRYVGRFEKGVDYIGDLEQFKEEFTQHVRVARAFGPYKLSLHSGSDKFSIYPIVAEVAGDLVHLKTAGTSYLEALRAISRANPELFKEILTFALERYETDRATYYVSGEASKVQQALAGAADDLSAFLDDFDARQVLHVTFGSVLGNQSLRQPFFETLKANEELHAQVLSQHFQRHFSPFRA